MIGTEPYIKLSTKEREFQSAINDISLRAAQLLEIPSGLSGQPVARYSKLTWFAFNFQNEFV